jgi:hypothetical protein
MNIFNGCDHQGATEYENLIATHKLLEDLMLYKDLSL